MLHIQGKMSGSMWPELPLAVSTALMKHNVLKSRGLTSLGLIFSADPAGSPHHLDIPRPWPGLDVDNFWAR